MDKPTIEFYCAIFGTFTIMTGWIWQSVRWYKTRAAQIQVAASRQRQLTARLVQSATSPATRADIHAYVQFQCTQVEARNTRMAMFELTMGLFISFTAVFYALLNRILDFSDQEWARWLMWSGIGFLAITYMVALLATQRLRKIEYGWLDSANEQPFNRAIAHYKES